MRTDQSCSNCNAWRKVQTDVGECLANPPVPLFMGMQEVPTINSSILKAAGRPPTQHQPIIHAAFPNIKSFGWCRKWEPRSEDITCAECCHTPCQCEVAS